MAGWIDQAELIQTAATHTSDEILRDMFPQGSSSAEGSLEFITAQPGLFGSVNAFRTLTEGSDRTVVRNSLGIQFVKTGRVEQNLPGHARYRHAGARITLTTFPREVRQVRTYEAGVDVKYVGAWVDPELLVDGFGVQVDDLPDGLRSFFRGEADTPTSISLPMPPRLWMALDDMFDTPHVGVLRETYLRAKLNELVCEVAGALARPDQPGRRPEGSAFTHRERMQVEMAAMIYARELSRPPSVDALAARVGLNRNTLTSGFREAFGCSPHEYSKSLRMDWAHRLLQDRSMTVGEIAAAVGYSTTAAFSRAYSDHFGFAPTRGGAA